MVPPATPTPTRRHGGGWRDSHYSPSAPYPNDYEVMSPNPYSVSRGPPPPSTYHYDSQGPLLRGPPGPPATDFWHPPSPYSSEHQHLPPPKEHRGGGGPYWTPPPSLPYDGYRGAPVHPGSLRGALHDGMNHPSQQYHTPSRRPYGAEQVGHEPHIPPSSPGNLRSFHRNHHKDFSPPVPVPAPATVTGQVSVQVAVSASADSEETAQSNARSKAIAETSTSLKNECGSDNDDDVLVDCGSDSSRAKKEGDPLRVLADVSAGMGGKNKKAKQEKDVETDAVASREVDDCGSDSDQSPGNESNRPTVPMPAPTSPLQRRLKPSPITPSQTPQVLINRNKRTPATRKHQPITPSRSHDTASSGEGVSMTFKPNWEPPSLPQGGSSGSGSEFYTPQSEYNSTLPPNDGPYNSPSRRNRSGFHYGSAGDFGPPFPTDSPALVERGSFDSHGDGSSYRGGAPLYPPSTPTSSRGGAYFYDDQPPPPGYSGSYSGNGGPYWDSKQPPYSPPYMHPNRGGGAWNQSYPPPAHSESLYGPPPQQGPQPDYPYAPPPPHYGGRDDRDLPYGNNPPPHPPYHHRGPPPPLSGPHHSGMPMHPSHMGGPPPPYAYGHPPRMEEKTILRKKFSWKHYPELERFLIANRDEYLKHSNMNYTAEQKQYNNWLTERLLEVASQHNYMFDPDEFNFVAIRDRIRCYYKSYVQTARKRGLKLPEKKKSKSKTTVEQKKE